jgi:phosphinothricin acetyltransferase
MTYEQATVRVATPGDAAAILGIYRHYVSNTAITYEIEVPTPEDMRGRIERTLERYPYLVIELDGKVLGYCYASAFRPRVAYLHSIETSIYLDKDARGGGMGRRLYETLDACLRLQNVTNAYACIAHSDPEVPEAPATSRRFHERLGYTLVGEFRKCAYKFDRWFDMIWMGKDLLPHDEHPGDFIPFPEIDQDALAAILEKA